MFFSSRSFTLVTILLPAYEGPGSLNIYIWNSLVAQSRSAEYGLVVQAPPVATVISLFPDTVEAASNVFVSVGLLNGPSSSSAVVVRTRNGSFVANASLDFASGGVQFFQF